MSPPIDVDREPPKPKRRRRAWGWFLLFVGVVVGSAVTILFGVTSEVSSESSPIPTLKTGGPTTTFRAATSVPEPVTGTASLAPVITEDVRIDPLLVVTGEFPETRLEVWSPGETEVLVQLPWFAGGLDTDASGSLFAFTGPSVTDSGSALYVGHGGGYMAFSIHTRSWTWHTTEPRTLAWIDNSGEEPLVMVSRLRIEPVGDRGEFLEVAEETSRLITARQDERIVAFTQRGVVLGVLNETRGESTARLIDLSGEITAEVEGLLAEAFTGDGVGVMAVPDQGSRSEYKMVGPDLETFADIGSHARGIADQAAWSPAGGALALVDYRDADEVDFHLEVWNRHGQQLLDLPLSHRVWGTTWTADGAHILLIGSDGRDWLGLLVVDVETGEMVALPAEREDIHEIAATG